MEVFSLHFIGRGGGRLNSKQSPRNININIEELYCYVNKDGSRIAVLQAWRFASAMRRSRMGASANTSASASAQM